MKDVRPRIKKLIANFPPPDWDPNRMFINFPRGSAPDIPFCHFDSGHTIFFRGAKFEFLCPRVGKEFVLRITIDGIMYHISTNPQTWGSVIYIIYFCKCDDLPVEMTLEYSDDNPRELYDVTVTKEVEIHYEYRSDHQEFLPTKDSEVKEFVQNFLNLCREFYITYREEIRNLKVSLPSLR